jgi:hypothetical protein
VWQAAQISLGEIDAAQISSDPLVFLWLVLLPLPDDGTDIATALPRR